MEQEKGKRCLVCRTLYPDAGQQVGPVWMIFGPNFQICRRCVNAGKDARNNYEWHTRQDNLPDYGR